LRDGLAILPLGFGWISENKTVPLHKEDPTLYHKVMPLLYVVMPLHKEDSTLCHTVMPLLYILMPLHRKDPTLYHRAMTLLYASMQTWIWAG